MLKQLQAIYAAIIFEACGAIFLGARVTSTIRNKIVNIDDYEDQPAILMFGMLSALMVGSLWLLTATAYELPVSTTHTIIAAIIGFSLAAEGFDSVDWHATVKIFISWVASVGGSTASRTPLLSHSFTYHPC